MKFFFLLFLLPFQLLAQDVTGVWTGTAETLGDEVPYEIVISEADGKLTGYAMTVFMFNGVENMGIKVLKIKRRNAQFTIEDEELVYDNYTTPPRKVKLYASLYLITSGPELTMSGTFNTRSLDFRAIDRTPFKGTMILRKQSSIASARLIDKLEELHLLSTLSFIKPDDERVAAIRKTKARQKEKTEPLTATPEKDTIGATAAAITDIKKEPIAINETKAVITEEKPVEKNKKDSVTTQEQVQIAAAAIALRKTEVIRNVFFTSDSLQLSLYDNGEIDGDTVSVVLNNKVIIEKKGLTTTPIRTTIHIPPGTGDSLQLVLYAENLGSIPPNTGLLIVQDGEEKHEIRFAGDYQKNAAIVLRRRR